MGLPPPAELLGLAFLLFLGAGAMGALPPSGSKGAARASLTLTLLGGLLLLAVALEVLLGGAGTELTIAVPGLVTAAPVLAVVVELDPLSGFFLLLLGSVGSMIVLASFGYTDRYVHARRARLTGVLGLFVASMALVIVAGSTFLFLVAWELMTLLSYLLVVHEHGAWEVRQAGLTYLVMSHVAAAALLAGFVLLSAGTGTTVFSRMAGAVAGLPPGTQDAVFAAVLLGFGTKAGLVPLHTWLPEAHPAAPSHVSSLMSGVMIKLGVYGMLRVVFQVLGGGPSWWGYLLLFLGGVSALAGVMNAIAQHDLKRLLAFHSVENIGIIFLALGAADVFLALGFPRLAALALLAGLLHTLNHALFKGLLFLGAGAVVGATGTRDMERLGGLAKAMPGTAIAFLLGAMAISALPPFNGFVSEWLLFHAFFGAFTTGSLGTEVAFTGAAAALALASGLAAYCFVKAYGITFLARARSPEARAVRGDAPPALLAGMALLAGGCLALGVLPGLLLSPLLPPVEQLTHATLAPFDPWALLGPLPAPSPSSAAAGGSLATGVVAGLLALGLALSFVLRRRGVRQPEARGAMWDCGLEAPTPRMEYTASGYAQPILRLFPRFYGGGHVAETGELGGARPGVLAKVVRHEVEVDYPIVEEVYAPLTRLVTATGRRVSRLQSGGIHAYLGYMILTLVVLLLAARFLGGGGP